ncbi:hypothetical protein LR69_02813 [Geobacillus sp. BCO2]|nr:hypothetical protein LR69_02813 [Geobacillus sp. BCO2]
MFTRPVNTIFSSVAKNRLHSLSKQRNNSPPPFHCPAVNFKPMIPTRMNNKKTIRGAFTGSCELPTTYASLRGEGFKRLVCVRRTVSHTQEPFTLPFVPKVSVLTIFYHTRWLTPTDIHLPLSLRFEVGDFFRKDVKNSMPMMTAPSAPIPVQTA